MGLGEEVDGQGRQDFRFLPGVDVDVDVDVRETERGKR